MTAARRHRGTGAQAATLLVFAVLGATPLRAQSIEAGALAFNAQHRVLFAGTVSERTGMFVGGQAAASLGPIRIRVAGFLGGLGAGGCGGGRGRGGGARDARWYPPRRG